MELHIFLPAVSAVLMKEKRKRIFLKHITYITIEPPQSAANVEILQKVSLIPLDSRKDL